MKQTLQQAYYSLQDTFDETCETYLEQNPGVEIAEAERKTFDELKSNYRQALISNYHEISWKKDSIIAIPV